ncbi:uncharacterized protein PAC_10579 [Phialocephala subalpina]|uniref:AAA+ ATPase domain-containing protein n=1 Tax=Phialocephala subalpina TaxID=576137 RepID=A0A1L7X6P7_9HELO|nr:uncharacterized protein PAC_10579 [Phialocephala subalpina]
MDPSDLATPGVFANARLNPDDNEDTGGLRCEMKTYEAHYNSSGDRVVLQAGVKRVERTIKARDHNSALILTKYYFRNKELERTELEVRSPHIRAALRAVIKEYPGMTFDAGRIIIRDDPQCLFHYRNELRTYGVLLEDRTAVEHLVFILNYMYRTLESEISSYYTFMESPSVAPGIEYKNLWMAFRPGDLIYTKMDGTEKIVKLKSTSKGWFIWILLTEEIQYNGTEYGRCEVRLTIRSYNGYKPLEELDAYPLQYSRRRESITNSLIARGKKFLGLRDVHHRHYEGLAETLSPFRISSYEGEEDRRIIIDSTKFGETRPTHKTHISSDKTIKSEPGKAPQLSDEELLICGHTITGFSLSNKRWCFFLIDVIEEFEYNTCAFGSLLLAPAQKKMIHSLIKIHKDERLQFDDLIKGKGKGMIFLLHGEPGVGKTLTAESVADYTQRPLYTISSGDLGVDAEAVERKLLDALELAAHWNAIVLIDEADVFLEQRSNHDLTRNGLVSVFLRLLEYYEGIMILTTNRIGAFDAAFKSRIHLAIKYPALSVASRRDLWTTFITNIHTRPFPPWWDEAFLESVAAEVLNGRQIKNVVRTAYALAVADGSELRPQDIHMSLKSITDFEEDFGHDEPDEALEPRGKRRRLE